MTPLVNSDAGVFETLRIEGGTALRLDQHLERLHNSVKTLYDRVLPVDLRDAVETTARSAGIRGAMRVTAVPSPDGGLDVEAALRDLPARTPPVRLRPVSVDGGLGAHRWLDRRYLNGVDAGDETPLLIDSDGAVLEAAWANVFVVSDSDWATPAADGRLLPGITRQALIEGADRAGCEIVTRKLTLEDLRSAEAILLTSALGPVTWGSVPGWSGDETRAAEIVSRARDWLAVI